MTSTDAAAPVFPPGRYGRRRAPGRRTMTRTRLTVLLIVGGLLGLVVAFVLNRKYGVSDYEPQVVGFRITGQQVAMRFEVHKPSGKPAVCHVRSRDRSGAEVGAADVGVPAGKDVTVTYTLAANGVPVSAEVTACHAR